MAFIYDRGLVMPVWAVAFCAATLSASPQSLPSLAALLSIAIIATMMVSTVTTRHAARAVPAAAVLPRRHAIGQARP